MITGDYAGIFVLHETGSNKPFFEHGPLLKSRLSYAQTHQLSGAIASKYEAAGEVILQNDFKTAHEEIMKAFKRMANKDPIVLPEIYNILSLEEPCLEFGNNFIDFLLNKKDEDPSSHYLDLTSTFSNKSSATTEAKRYITHFLDPFFATCHLKEPLEKKHIAIQKDLLVDSSYEIIRYLFLVPSHALKSYLV
jgi:hypothetical protein